MFKWLKDRYTREQRLRNCEERIVLLQKEVERLKELLHYRDAWPPWGRGIALRDAVTALVRHLGGELKVKPHQESRVVFRPWDPPPFNFKAGPETHIDGLPECPTKVKGSEEKK
jgi:hypothetical protein